MESDCEHCKADLSRHQFRRHLMNPSQVVELGRLLLDVGRLVGINQGRVVLRDRRLLDLIIRTAQSAVATCPSSSQSRNGQLWRPLVMFRGRV